MLVPKPVFFIAALGWLLIILVLLLILAFVIRYGGFGHAWDEFWGNDIEVKNTTDARLCLDFHEVTAGCMFEINPRATSRHSPTISDCSGNYVQVTIFEPQADIAIYSRDASCDELSGATILINRRDGEFVVADSLQSPY